MDPTTFRLLSGAAAEAAPPVEITFTASTYYLQGNQTSYLSWGVLNSSSVSINQGIGSVAATGSAGVNVNGQTVTYTLTALGLNGITYTSSLSIAWTNWCIWVDFGWPQLC